jgi:NAD(P)-dependent dehydrogenase (short-subunit alcohol dehydrogenase family)
VQSVPYPLGTHADLEETANLVSKEGRQAVVVSGDVRRIEDLRGAVTTAVAEFGKLDILLANAGIVTYHQMVDMDDRAWQDMIDVNLTGAANSIRAVLPQMIEQKYGRIVATSSQAGRRGVPNLGHYCASKWGLIGLVKTVALETAPMLGITCNAVLPGGVDTPMMRHDEVYRTFAPEIDEPTVEDLEERLRMMNPMPITWIEAIDISHAVLFLASDEARYVSGATLDIAAAFNANGT